MVYNTYFQRIIAGLFLVLLSGCARYKSKSLNRLATNQQVTHQAGNVSFAAKAFTTAESKRFLGKDVIAAGYQPIQITIINNTKRYLRFSAERMSLPTVPANIVAQNVYDSTASRVIGWGITGLFIPVFLIPAIVDSSWSYEANEKLHADYKTKAPHEKILEPGTELNGVVFVPTEQYKTPFTITLLDEESSERIVCTC